MAVYDLLIRGRLLLPGADAGPGTIAVSDGRIVALGDREAEWDAKRELDAGDALVIPGVVDAHVHTRSTPDEGIAAATRAAAAGGVTTVIDMPYDAGGAVSGLDALAAKIDDVEREALVDVALWATVLPHGPLGEVAELVRAGACAFKLSTFETHPRRFPRIPDDQMLAAFAAIAAAGGLAGVHSENDEIVRAGIAAEQAAGRSDPLAHARSRPAVAETNAIAGCLELARAAGTRLHLCHVTVGRGVELAARARADGVDVTVETCPHYLLLDAGELERRGGEAKINPPLRPSGEVDALWRGVRSGAVDIVASDHVGWPVARKHGEDIFAIASGAPGLDLMLTLVHDAMMARGLGLATLSRVLSEAPARRFGLWPRKGSLMPGADADVVVLDPHDDWVVDPATLVSAAGWSPYTGRTVRSRVRHVFSRGAEVFANGEVLGRPGRGRFAAAGAREPAALVPGA
jgi:allantoinase